MTKLISYLECIESAQAALTTEEPLSAEQRSAAALTALAYIELGREATKNGAWREFVNGRPGQ